MENEQENTAITADTPASEDVADTANRTDTADMVKERETAESAAGGGVPGGNGTKTDADAWWRLLNREAIKYIAIAAMTLNHIANVGLLHNGSPLRELFVNIGYITAITMSFFLVEGYHYTRSKVRYGLRLFVFSLLSQIPFQLAFQRVFGKDVGLNMIFTLWLCFMILVVMEYVRPLLLRIPLVCGLILLSYHSDWALIIPVVTVLFELSRGNRVWQFHAYGTAALLQWLMTFRIYARYYIPEEAQYRAMTATLPLLVSAVLTLGLYNGRQAKRCRAFHRWFFYVYYPAHLLVIAAVQRVLLGW